MFPEVWENVHVVEVAVDGVEVLWRDAFIFKSNHGFDALMMKFKFPCYLYFLWLVLPVTCTSCSLYFLLLVRFNFFFKKREKPKGKKDF